MTRCRRRDRPQEVLRREWIDDLQVIYVREIVCVAGGEDESTREGDGGDLRILDTYGAAGTNSACDQIRVARSGTLIEGQTASAELREHA